MTFRHLGTPEDVFTVSSDVPPGYPIDAMDCALSRAEAVLELLAGQFDGSGAARLADHIICDALWAVSGELAGLRKLFDHGSQTEAQRVAEDLNAALSDAARAPVAPRKRATKEG